jgi:predicted RecB family nuclease
MRQFTYLHGVLERWNGDNGTERFVPFFTEAVTEAEEERAFADAIAYLRDRPDAVIYYYSKYERTIWRKLRERYPEVCSSQEVEDIFTEPRSVDLYFDVVLKKTEWPTRDFSIKTLAKYLGFAWRDTDPSGASSIEWFHQWVESGDATVRQRIIDYNEDDCRATRVLVDGLRTLYNRR